MKNKLLLVDIIFCAVLLPGMMFLFPTGEWLQWHAGYVLIYVLWLYGVLILCRKVLGPLMLQGWRGCLTVAGVLFLAAAVTFLMTLTSVDFPKDPSQLGKMEPHIRAMWILLLAVVSYGVPVGMFSAALAQLSSQKEADEALAAAREALEQRRQEAPEVSGEEIQVKADYKTVHIPLSAIRYVEGRNNYACFHLDNRPDVVSQITLKEVLALLPEGKFVRIHRSYIVPEWRIEKRSSAQVKLLGVDQPLPVGRAFKENLKNG